MGIMSLEQMEERPTARPVCLSPLAAAPDDHRAQRRCTWWKCQNRILVGMTRFLCRTDDPGVTLQGETSRTEVCVRMPRFRQMHAWNTSRTEFRS